jgi:protein-S-isoprenylcysteine O-methyltransferase Ste14
VAARGARLGYAGAMKTNLISLGILVILLVESVPLLRHMEWTGTKAAGAVLAAASLILLVVARLQLGASFSVSAQARRLVTTGVYSRLRNPIYGAAALLFVGMSLLLASWLPLLLAAVTTPIQLYRARNEERVLAAAFGEEYERYKSTTWF